MMSDYDDRRELAEIAFTAYSTAVGGKNVQGSPIPAWADLGEVVQGGWVAAAQAVSDALSGPEAAD